jgi:hypothetical protein
MNLKQILIVTAIAALAPIAAQAGQKFGEAYPLDIEQTSSTLTRADVREEVLALERVGQNFGEAYPFQAKDPMTMRQQAEVRREAREAQRMYGEISGYRSHN